MVVDVEIFQFHYGTIKSEPKEEIAPGMTVFQFHYGTIKSLFPRPEEELLHLISIPLWYD